MEAIFKVKHGTYVDLSRIVAIDFHVEKVSIYEIKTIAFVYFEKTETEMVFKSSQNETGVLKIYDFINVGDDSRLYDLCVGKMNDDLTRDYNTINISAALELARNKTIEKYSYLIDAWKEYKEWHSKYTE